MIRLLLDANLSNETALYLRKVFSFDVIDLQSSDQGTLTDDDVVLFAKQERRIIVTFDNDLGEIYYLRERGNLGIIVLRLNDQTIESVNGTLNRFFRQHASSVELERSLVVIGEDRTRIVRPR